MAGSKKGQRGAKRHNHSVSSGGPSTKHQRQTNDESIHSDPPRRNLRSNKSAPADEPSTSDTTSAVQKDYALDISPAPALAAAAESDNAVDISPASAPTSAAQGKKPVLLDDASLTAADSIAVHHADQSLPHYMVEPESNKAEDVITPHDSSDKGSSTASEEYFPIQKRRRNRDIFEENDRNMLAGHGWDLIFDMQSSMFRELTRADTAMATVKSTCAALDRAITQLGIYRKFFEEEYPTIHIRLHDCYVSLQDFTIPHIFNQDWWQPYMKWDELDKRDQEDFMAISPNAESLVGGYLSFRRMLIALTWRTLYFHVLEAPASRKYEGRLWGAYGTLYDAFQAPALSNCPAESRFRIWKNLTVDMLRDATTATGEEPGMSIETLAGHLERRFEPFLLPDLEDPNIHSLFLGLAKLAVKFDHLRQKSHKKWEVSFECADFMFRETCEEGSIVSLPSNWMRELGMLDEEIQQPKRRTGVLDFVISPSLTWTGGQFKLPDEAGPRDNRCACSRMEVQTREESLEMAAPIPRMMVSGEKIDASILAAYNKDGRGTLREWLEKHQYICLEAWQTDRYKDYPLANQDRDDDGADPE